MPRFETIPQGLDPLFQIEREEGEHLPVAIRHLEGAGCSFCIVSIALNRTCTIIPMS